MQLSLRRGMLSEYSESLKRRCISSEKDGVRTLLVVSDNDMEIVGRVGSKRGLPVLLGQRCDQSSGEGLKVLFLSGYQILNVSSYGR